MWVCVSPEAHRVSNLSRWATVLLLLLVIFYIIAALTGGRLPVLCRSSTHHLAAILQWGSSPGVKCGFVRRLNPTECHMYLDGQEYFIEVVLDISRKATVVKRRGSTNSVLSQRWAIAPPL